MDNKDRRRYEMLTRVRDFGTTYGHLFPESTLAAQTFAAVSTAVDDIEAADVAETTASVSARATRKQDARRALLDQLTLLSNTAQALPDADPGVKAHFVLRNTRDDQVLLTTARQFVQRAGAMSEPFLKHGMPTAFIDNLNGLIGNFEEALRDRGISRDQSVEARGRIKQAFDNALQAVGQLDVLVANHLAVDAVVRDVWKRARRIVYPNKPRRAAAGEQADVEATTATPTPPPLPDAPAPTA